MTRKSSVSTVLAGLGTLLVWLPILLPLVLSLRFLIPSGRFRIDFLMPAELAPLYLLGALCLYVAARGAKTLSKSIAATSVAAIVFLIAAQGTAVLTGLASGEREAAGWPLYLCIAFLALYTITVILTGLLALRVNRSLGAKNG